MGGATKPSETQSEGAKPVKVSVVVPVYNPGRHIEPLLASLRRQSLGTEEFEVVFVDDGSTDGTAVRLDQVAGEVANFRVIHIANSGWPGRPRNVGLDAARGEYVQFADNDDELGDEALERLYDFARRNGSDVVVGREIRTDRVFPYGMRLFNENHPRIDVEDERLLGPLTPHKMFRRQFLADHGIRFPERPRIFEDYAFVLESYLLADVISVLSDYLCYVWRQRDDKSNAGETSYGRSYADTIDVVLRRTEPGPFRDRMLAYWYRRRVLDMVNPAWAADERAEPRLRSWRAATDRHFPVEVDTHLPALMRVRSALLRAGDMQRLKTVAVHRVALAQGPTGVRVGRRDVVLSVEAWLSGEDGSPLQAGVDDGRVRWRPSIDLGGAVSRDALDVTDDLAGAWLEVIARRRGARDALLLPTTSRRLDEHGTARRLGAGATAVLRHGRRSDGARTVDPGTWDLLVGLSVAGWYARAPLRSPPSSTPGKDIGSPVLAGDQLIRLSAKPDGTLCVVVEPRGRRRLRAPRRARPVLRVAARNARHARRAWRGALRRASGTRARWSGRAPGGA